MPGGHLLKMPQFSRAEKMGWARVSHCVFKPIQANTRCHNISLAENKYTPFKVQENDCLSITSYTRESEAGVDPPPTAETVQSLKKSKSRKRWKETVQLLFFRTLTAHCCWGCTDQPGREKKGPFSVRTENHSLAITSKSTSYRRLGTNVVVNQQFSPQCK